MKRVNDAASWIRKNWNQGIALMKRNKIKTTTSVIVLSMFVTGSALASHYYNANTHTLYHVMLDGKEIGTVDNPDVINQYINKRISAENYDKDALKEAISNRLAFREESKFKEQASNEQTLQELQEQLELKVAAQALIIDGKTVGYVNDRNTIDNALKELKQKYGQLPLAANKMNTVKTASADDSANDKIQFKESLDVKPAQVAPDLLLTKDELLTLLEKGTLEQVIHKVQQGDCISAIAAQYGITSNDIYRMNPGITEDTVLKLGQPVIVTAMKPKLTVQLTEEKQVDEQIPYQVKVDTTDDMYRGDSKVTQEGKEGTKRVTYKIVKENGVETNKTVLKEEVLSEPVDKIIQKGTKVKPNRGDGEFAWPTYGGTITSMYGTRWGAFHKGIDISGVSNKNIKAADNGRVVLAGWSGNYGNCVIIDHGNGYSTKYGHLSSIGVSVGDVVQQGETIGVMGATGDATGVHLHFEVLRGSTSVNPLQYVHR